MNRYNKVIFFVQKVEDNDEAEQIIRAITHGEIDQKVLSYTLSHSS